MRPFAAMAGLAVLCWAGQAAAVDGRQVAAACAGCHAPGAGSTASIPPLAGQSEDATAASLLAYRSGARPSQVMSVVARALSPAEITAVAHYLASEKGVGP